MVIYLPPRSGKLQRRGRRDPLILIHLEPSEEFLIQRAVMTETLGGDAETVFRALGDALEKLKETGWGPELGTRKIGGNKFAYPFDENYEVTFLVKGQRPPDQPVEEMWLQLLTIQIRNRDLESG